MQIFQRRVCLLVATFLIIGALTPTLGAAFGSAMAYNSNLSKIDPKVFSTPTASTGAATGTASSGGSAASPAASSGSLSVVFVQLKNLANPDWKPLGHDFVVNALQSVAYRSQVSVVSLVRSHGGAVLHQFWLTNGLLVATDAATMREIAQNPLVERIEPNFAVSLPPDELGTSQSPLSGNEWNIDKVNAPGAWALGIRGEGVRVCITDTGVDITHPDIAGKMFTINPSDPYYPGGFIEYDGNGNIVPSQPHDSWIHGTHVSGTVLGGNAGGTQIGVAPGASLMMGLVLPGGSGTFAQVIAGMQWCVNPTDKAGVPTGFPGHLQSMSWGAGGLQPQLLDPTKNSLLAGIILVAAQGNEGQGTTRTPGAIWGIYGAGATDINDNVAGFSGGMVINWPSPPANWPFFGGYPASYLKPDFSAPGVDVRSSVPGGYQTLSGTSMATPHIAATVAMMLQASGFSLTPEQAYLNLKATVLDLGAPGQDDRFGWGRLDTGKAVLLSLVRNTGVKGTVYETQSGLPLGDVKVTAEELGAFTTTKANGTFKLSLPEGTYNISFDKFGYFHKVFHGVVVKLYNGTLAGYVTTGAGSPISGANVWIHQANENLTTDANGYFTASLKSAKYDLTVSASGYVPAQGSADVPENATAWTNFTLAPNVPGFVQGTVTYASNSSAAAGVLVWAEGPAKYQALTNANGTYSISVDSINAGAYRVAAFKGGFWPPSANVTVVPGSITTADFSIAASTNRSIAVYQDWSGNLTGLLTGGNYTPHSFQAADAVALKWSLSAFPVVYWSGFSALNNSQGPTHDTFVDILSIANAVGVSLVLGDSYNGWPYGISLMSMFTGNPASRSYTYSQGNVYFHISAAHEIFNGVGAPGDNVTVLLETGGDDGDHTWFAGFNGTTLAQVGTSSTGIQGDSVAVSAQSGGTQWVLLGGFAPQFWTHVSNDWTPAATRIFSNSIAFGASHSWATGLGTHLAAIKPTLAPIAHALSAFAPAAFTILNVYLDKMPSGDVAGTITDNYGNPLFNVSVSASGTPVKTTTDTAGNYSMELPVGVWTIVAAKFGYETASGTANITANQTVTLDLIMQKQRRAGIMYDDSGGPIQALLLSTGKFAVSTFAGDWDALIAAVPTFDVVILNGQYFGTFPSQVQFQALLDAANTSRTGIVFLDQIYGVGSPLGQHIPRGGSLLTKYTGDPSGRSENPYCQGDGYQAITGSHAITHGFAAGDVTKMATYFNCFPTSWFSGFSGTTVGKIAVGSGSNLNVEGDNLAYKVTAMGSRWALMASYGSVFGFQSTWTTAANQIFVNSVLWASTKNLPMTSTPATGPVGTLIHFGGSRAPANVLLQVSFDDTVTGTIHANAAGAFTRSLTGPQATYRRHSVNVGATGGFFCGEAHFAP